MNLDNLKNDLNKTTIKSYEEKYGSVNKIDAEIEDLKQKVMGWVFKNYNAIWT